MASMECIILTNLLLIFLIQKPHNFIYWYVCVYVWKYEQENVCECTFGWQCESSWLLLTKVAIINQVGCYLTGRVLLTGDRS